MFSKNKQKMLRSLSQKKFRDEYGVFIAEGNKLVLDLLPVMHCNSLLGTKDWLSGKRELKADEIIELTEKELSSISTQKSPQGVFAVFKKPEYKYELKEIAEQLVIALDDIQDPGNLGTIVRIADWFGILDIFCSKHTADIFSPKAVQATMGALARVRVHSVDLEDFLSSCEGKTKIYGTFLDGEDIYKEEDLSQSGIIVMGNEGNGISHLVEKRVNKRLLIPAYPIGESQSESLNVGIAAAIVCSEFRRRQRG